jgi:DNA processing protein
MNAALSGPDRIARALLTWLVSPADPGLPGLLAAADPGQVLACIRSGTTPARITEGPGERAGLRPLLDRWRSQLARLPADGGITAARQAGIRLICPGDGEWPEALDDLGDARPCALWVRGINSLDACCARSVAIVGARAATAYGAHVTAEITAGLAGAGLTIVSGGAYGIDGAAHKGALAAGGLTIAVLACGPDVAYPAGHAGLLGQIAASGGLIVSESPPGRRPSRAAFLARNRITAALGAGGMVVIEAGLRSGTLDAVGHADLLGRPVMAVPGPVTSAVSAGCHQLIAECAVPLVTCAADVLTHLAI